MKGCLGQGLERCGAVVSCVEDQRDVITGPDQIPVVGGQLCGDGTELDAVVDMAGVDAVKQWDVKIGAHQQAQIDLPQVASLLFDMAPLGQLGRGTGIDVGEEVGAVGWASRIALLPMFRWKMWMPFWSTKVLVALSEGATLAAPQRTTAPLVDGGEVARGDEMRRSMLFPAGAGRIQLISPRR